MHLIQDFVSLCIISTLLQIWIHTFLCKLLRFRDRFCPKYCEQTVDVFFFFFLFPFFSFGYIYTFPPFIPGILLISDNNFLTIRFLFLFLPQPHHCVALIPQGSSAFFKFVG